MQGQEAMQGQALDLSCSVLLHTGGTWLLPMQHDQQGWLQLNCFLSQEGHRRADPPSSVEVSVLLKLRGIEGQKKCKTPYSFTYYPSCNLSRTFCETGVDRVRSFCPIRLCVLRWRKSVCTGQRTVDPGQSGLNPIWCYSEEWEGCLTVKDTEGHSEELTRGKKCSKVQNTKLREAWEEKQSERAKGNRSEALTESFGFETNPYHRQNCLSFSFHYPGGQFQAPANGDST